MSTAKVNTQHDYISIAATFPEGRLNMTYSRSGYKVSSSAPGITGDHLRATMRKMGALQKSGRTYAEQAVALADAVQAAANVAEFLATEIV